MLVTATDAVELDLGGSLSYVLCRLGTLVHTASSTTSRDEELRVECRAPPLTLTRPVVSAALAFVAPSTSAVRWSEGATQAA
jgi:hypothetical protein